MAPHADETNENGTNGTKGTNKANGTSGVHGTSDVHSTSPIPGLWITGIASQYPPYLLGPEKLNEFTWRFFDVEEPGYAETRIGAPLRYLAKQKESLADIFVKSEEAFTD